MIDSAYTYKKTNRASSRELKRRALFFLIHGILVVPAYLFQKNILIKAFIAVCYCLLLSIELEKIKIIPQAFVFCAILVTNLFVPDGLVLFRIVTMPITSGALQSGIEKGLNVVGLLFISRFSIKKEIVIPGRFGTILTHTLSFFDSFLEHHKPLKFNKGAANLLKQIDAIIVRIWNLRSFEGARNIIKPSKSYLIVLLFLVIINWVLYILSQFIS